MSLAAAVPLLIAALIWAFSAGILYQRLRSLEKTINTQLSPIVKLNTTMVENLPCIRATTPTPLRLKRTALFPNGP